MVAILAAFAAGITGGSDPAIVFVDDPARPGFGTVVVTGLAPAALATLGVMPLDEGLWSALFPVTTDATQPEGGGPATGGEARPPILGTWRVEDDLLRFTPRFPLATGIGFTAIFDGVVFDHLTGHAGPPTPRLELGFSMPAPRSVPSTVVEAVDPGIDVVPENLLRLYIHFSAPMKEQRVGGSVRIHEEGGAEVDLPFVEIPEGLWDPPRRRLTLLFHPGRIKRGVGPHETMGTPLREGRRYRLVVETSLRDAQGHPLARPYEWPFRAGPADRVSPDPASFGIVAPSASSSPLSIEFHEPLDRALARRLIGVEDSAGRPVDGLPAVSRDGTAWSFAPAGPWRPGRYAIVIQPDLEDLAGNTPGRLFDVEGRDAAGDTPAGGAAPGASDPAAAGRDSASPRPRDSGPDRPRPIRLGFDVAG